MTPQWFEADTGTAHVVTGYVSPYMDRPGYETLCGRGIDEKGQWVVTRVHGKPCGQCVRGLGRLVREAG